MLRSVCLLICVLIAHFAFGAEDVFFEKVHGPELPGTYKHPASITELDNGDLLICYYGGGGEYEDDSKVWGTRKKKGEDAWGPPIVFADTPFRGEGNPIIWQAPDGVVWLFYVQRYGDTWSEARIKAKLSYDGAQTWSDSFMVAFDMGMMARGLPIVLNDGDYLLPVYHETGDDREKMPNDTASMFLRYSPKTHAFTPTNKIFSRMGNLQPEAVQIDDDYLIAYCRRAGDYDPRTDGWAVRSESRDGGRTWSKGEDSLFPNPNSALGFIKLRSGNLLMVYNDNMNDRMPLSVAISTDNDKTWGYKRDIGTDKNTYAYPMPIQTQDGKIHIVFTTDGRKQVMHAVLDESAILSYPVK